MVLKVEVPIPRPRRETIMKGKLCAVALMR